MPTSALSHTLSARVLASPLPLPDPSTPSQVDADLVTPGLYGFLTLFLSAVAVYFLCRSMARRVQRVNQRARLQQMQDQALAGALPPTQTPLPAPLAPEDDEAGTTTEAQELIDDPANLHPPRPHDPSSGQSSTPGTSSPSKGPARPEPSAVKSPPGVTGRQAGTAAGAGGEVESS